MTDSVFDQLQDVVSDVESAVSKLRGLSTPKIETQDWLEAKVKVGRMVDDLSGELNRISVELGLPSGRERILQYLRGQVGQKVSGKDLAAVSGIGEWARRVRELRVEEGWSIESGDTSDDLKPSEYVLVAAEPDEVRAHEWRTAKQVRNLEVADGRRASGKARILEYLQAVYPRSATKDQLAYVTAGMQEWTRRVRELVEEGWQIDSHLDDGRLGPGDYRLTAMEKLAGRPREAIKLRHQVLDRDDWSCCDCGRSPKSDRVRLQAHHIVPVNEGGGNELSNLVTRCSQCHAGHHSIDESLAFDELLNGDGQSHFQDRA